MLLRRLYFKTKEAVKGDLLLKKENYLYIRVYCIVK